ncbi:MAG: putative porin [Bacteroidales bacterium]
MKKIIIASLCMCFFLANIFAQQEDTLKNNSDSDTIQVQSFLYNSFYSKRIQSSIDTILDTFHEYEPQLALSDYGVNLGYYASPSFKLTQPFSVQSVFFLNTVSRQWFFANNTLNRYVARKPYTSFTYSLGDFEQQHISFIHTQNYSKDLNVGIRLRYYKSMGEYSGQEVKGRHIAPWFSYTGDMYTAHGSFAFNYMSHVENGGLRRDSLIDYPLSIVMNHSDAISEKKSYQGELIQKWNVGDRPVFPDTTRTDLPLYSGALGHSFSYKKSNFMYTDNSVSVQSYPSVLYDSLYTNDSIEITHITNSLFFERYTGSSQRGFFHVGVGHEYKYEFFKDYDFMFPQRDWNSLFYEGQFLYSLSNVDFEHTHKWYMVGAYSDDFSAHTQADIFDIHIFQNPVSFSLEYDVSRKKQQGILQHFQSNHVTWDRDNVPVFHQKIAGTLSIPYFNIDLAGSLSQINNMMYFSSDLQLHQLSSRTFVTQMEVRKKTRIWNFVLDNRFVYQNVESHAVDLPEWISYNAVYYAGSVYKNLIKTHIGCDFLWFSEYNAPLYMPSLGVFAHQETDMIGNYPISQAFISIKYKPIRISFKYKGLYSQFVDKNFLFPHYPQQSGSFSLAVSWFFFN